MYPLGASPHSSFNLNKMRSPCLVGCLEEYDNRLRAQITFLMQTKMCLTMVMMSLSSKRRRYDRGRTSSFKRMIFLFLTTMLIKNSNSYAYSLRRTRAYHNKNPSSNCIYNHDFLNEFKENMQYSYIKEGRNNDTSQFCSACFSFI